MLCFEELLPAIVGISKCSNHFAARRFWMIMIEFDELALYVNKLLNLLTHSSEEELVC